MVEATRQVGTMLAGCGCGCTGCRAAVPTWVKKNTKTLSSPGIQKSPPPPPPQHPHDHHWHDAVAGSEAGQG